MPPPVQISTRGIFGRRLVLDDIGIRRGSSFLTWDEVDYYLYDWKDWARAGDFLVVSRRGRVRRIAPIFDHWEVAADRLLDELHRRLRAIPYFDPFALDDDTLVHVRAGRLPFADIDRVEVAALGPNVIVVVHARGAGEWATADASQIADLWLWLELLSEKGVTILSSLSLHLPMSRSDLSDRISAAARLPRATVVRSR